MRKHRNRVETAYKRSPVASAIRENVEKATAQFDKDNPGLGGKYDMILVATRRAKDLKKGMPTEIVGVHKPTVIALLEIEAGLVKWDYTTPTFEQV